MTAAQLKASILDQAIRGHLTAKWREERKRRGEGEENAVELLARITAARNAASPKKGKAKTPASPQPVGEDEKPFELPESWVWSRVGMVANVLAGYPFDAKGYSPSGVRICGGLIIMPDEIRWADCKFWPDAEGLEKFLLK